jgi:tetratricopeptide (TPR) repeat protein
VTAKGAAAQDARSSLFIFGQEHTTVAKRPKQRTHLPPSPALLRSRVERAAAECRYQHALELGKQLYKQEPSLAHCNLLHRVYLGRAQQLRKQGYLHDAQILLENAAELTADDPAQLEEIAEELARCGALRRAVELVQRIPCSPAQHRILARVADAALQQGPAGWKELPEALAASFDLIQQAFAQLEAGEDERVRETLQGIGLQSPFLEWKVLLRGLLAFYQDNNERALENWQRLDPDRLPARLAAPLRFQIDTDYRLAQPPAVQTALQKQADRLQASGLVQPLRTLQAVLADADQLPHAFRLAEGLLQSLRQQFPHLVLRLAACFYWAVINGGQPEDARRYERVFGAPPDDPGFDRLRALLYEHMGDMAKAHQHWQQFERSVARNPAAWPGEQARHVRALVWCRMGRNAASVPDPDKIPDLPPFLRDHPDRPRPLKPSAPECFRRSLELAPDQLDAHEALLHYHKQEQDIPAAEEAARRFLEHFPEHVRALEELADIRGHQGDHAEALGLLQRALKVNPLDRSLRAKVGTEHLFNARSHAEAGRFAEARAEYQTALSYRQGKDESSVLCKWAACEFKARETARAEELLQRALTESGNHLAIAYSMVIETIRLKLPAALKNRFAKEFKRGLVEPPTAAAAVALVESTTVHQTAGVKYRGQKTHEREVLAYAEKALKVDFTEEQLESIANSLIDLKAIKVLRKFTSLGRRRYPRNALFPFLEAESYFSQGPYRFPAWKVQPLINQAAKLARDLPPDEKQKALLEKIEQYQQMLGLSSYLFSPQSLGILEEMFEQVLAGEEDADDDYDEEY